MNDKNFPISVKKASEITGLSICTICVHAKRKNIPMFGSAAYLVSERFLEYLKTLKPKKRKAYN
jgi:hypothetical protein